MPRTIMILEENSAEIELRQDQPYGVQYVDPMIIRIQEEAKNYLG